MNHLLSTLALLAWDYVRVAGFNPVIASSPALVVAVEAAARLDRVARRRRA